MPDNNLTATFRIDTKKLDADLALLKTRMTQAARDLQQAANRAGGVRTKEVDALAASYDNLRKEYIATTRVLQQGYAVYGRHAAAAQGAAAGVKALSSAHKELGGISSGATREVFKLSKEFGNLEVSTFNIAKALKEFPKAAIPVAVVGAVAAAVTATTDAAAKNIEALENLSKASRFAQEDIVALRKAFREQNVESGLADVALAKLGETFDKVKAKAGDLSGGIVVRPGGETGGVAVLKGGGAQGSQFGPGGTLVLRGGRPTEVPKTIEDLVSPAQFKDDAEGRRKWLEEAVKVLTNIQKTEPALAMQVARATWGDEAEKIMRGLKGAGAEQFGPPGPGGRLPGFLEPQRATTAGAPELLPEAAPRTEEFGKAQKEAAAQAENVGTRTGLSMMTAVTDAMKRGESFTKALDDAIQHTRDNWDGLQADISKGIDAQQSAEKFESGWTGVFEGILSAWQKTVDGINAAQPTVQTPGGSFASPYATGGVVPGTGSGDTVPAWLTPGEYVARKSSVGYYGAGVFSALNNRTIPRDLFRGYGYALGGLVARHHFADGGMVESSGGRLTVDLHMGGHSFPMSSDREVANRLVRFARSESMRSAGIKPSWVS